MPSPGQVNNPGGSNSYGNNGTEEPYGAIERRKVLTDMAPPGHAAALSAPERAQDAATRKKKVQSPVTSNAASQPEVTVNPLAEFWASLASEEGASALVREYAAKVNNAG